MYCTASWGRLVSGKADDDQGKEAGEVFALPDYVTPSDGKMFELRRAA
jgi:hypothetical protein